MSVSVDRDCWGELTISTHAVERYRERVERVSEAEAVTAIRQSVARAVISGRDTFDPLTLLRLPIRGNVVTTVICPVYDFADRHLEIALEAGRYTVVIGDARTPNLPTLNHAQQCLVNKLRSGRNIPGCGYGCLLVCATVLGKREVISRHAATNFHASALRRFWHQAAVHKRWQHG